MGWPLIWTSCWLQDFELPHTVDSRSAGARSPACLHNWSIFLRTAFAGSGLLLYSFKDRSHFSSSKSPFSCLPAPPPLSNTLDSPSPLSKEKRYLDLEDPSPSQKCKNPKSVTKGPLCSKAFTSHKKHIKEVRGRKPERAAKLRRALTCNNSMLQNRNDMRSLHGYNTLYLWKAQLPEEGHWCPLLIMPC